jgi:hypothetical protein
MMVFFLYGHRRFAVGGRPSWPREQDQNTDVLNGVNALSKFFLDYLNIYYPIFWT